MPSIRKKDESILLSCEIQKMKNDTEFSNLFEQFIEKRSKYITNKFPHKISKEKITRTESVSENCESKMFNRI